MFSRWCSIDEMALFGGFLSPFSLKYGSNLLKFWSEVVCHNTKTVFEQSLQVKCLSGNGTYPKFTVLVHFRAKFTPGKPKILPKTKIFSETTSLWLSNNPSSRLQINHRILIKLTKNNIFWAKNARFKVKNRPVKKGQEVRGQVSTTFSEVPKSGLTVDENIFIVGQLKLALFQFQCHFF